jgi:hypothetical protein
LAGRNERRRKGRDLETLVSFQGRAKRDIGEAWRMNE